MMTKTKALPTRKQSRTAIIRRATCALLLAGSALLLTACATTPKTDPLVERAQARWDALTSGDLETAYTFYSPGYRSSTSLIDFGVAMRTRKVKWSSATYKDHECEESRCTVRFDVAYRVPRPVPGLKVWDSTAVIKDTWIKVDGQWWYLPVKQ
jgi:hypothetical protein